MRGNQTAYDVLVYNDTEDTWTLFESEPAAAILPIITFLRRSRWAHIRRFGRPGKRLFVVTMRNTQERTMRPLPFKGVLVSLSLNAPWEHSQ